MLKSMTFFHTETFSPKKDYEGSPQNKSLYMKLLYRIEIVDNLPT